MVGTIMSVHAVLLLRATWHEAHLFVVRAAFVTGFIQQHNLLLVL